MASKQANVDFVVEQMGAAGDVTARKMFGEYALYLRGKIVALFCDDQLFVKPTNAGRSFIGKVKEAPPYPGSKAFFLVGGDRCEDGEWLSELVALTERELPAPKPTPVKAAKAAKKAPVKVAKKAAKATKAPQKASATSKARGGRK